MSPWKLPVTLLIIAAIGCGGPSDEPAGNDAVAEDAALVVDAAPEDQACDSRVSDDDSSTQSKDDGLKDEAVEDAAKDTGDDSDTNDAGHEIDGPFHVAMIADCHLLPLDENYEPNSLVAPLLRNISAWDPDIAALFSLGDNIEDFMLTYEDAAAGYPVPAIETVPDFFNRNTPLPWYLVFGNHDNRFGDTFQGNDLPISIWLKYFEGTTHLPATWYSVKIGGFNFVVLFGSDGATDHATNDTNILLADQIAWLRSELALGMPTVLLYHQWIDAPADGAVGLHPIHQAVVDFPGVVKATFAGHGHTFAHYTFGGADFYQIGAAKYSGENVEGDVEDEFLHDFGYVLCDPGTGSVTLENFDTIQWTGAP